MRGVALYLAVVIMGVFLALALGIATILYSQMKMLREMGDSVFAFYAANTGIERALYGVAQGDPVGSHYEGSLNGSSYSADIIEPTADGECSDTVADYYCIKSVGVFEKSQTKRAIKIVR